MAVSQVQRRLKNLISYVSVPALVINVRKGKILCNNPAAVRRYGSAVSSGSPIMLRGVEPGTDVGQLRLLTETEGFAVEAIDEGEGDFELQCHSSTIGLLLETSSQFDQPAPQFLPDTASYPSFHFCYLHKVLNDQRIYPDPGLMKQLKLTRHTRDALKLKWRDLIVDEDRSLYDKAVATAIEHGANQRLRYRIRTIEGDEHEIIDCFGVVREEGMWPVLTGTIISTGGSANRMQQAERMSLVGRLAGSMIHDFRNLLGGMQNMLEWCMAHSPDDSPVHKAINKTIGYTDQANGLIRTTLRLLDGKDDGDKERIPVQELLNDVEGLMRHFGSATTRIRISCDRELPPLYGQRSVFLDMMLNLGLNACDAMEEKGGVLQFEAVKKRIVDRSGARRDFICLRVIDNGCGMSAEEAQSIFNEFYTTKEHGTGLGLWMVKEATHAMGGMVQVQSKPGQGSTFEVQIPVLKEAGTGKAKAPARKAGKFGAQELAFAKGKTVLFIEDEPLLRDGVQTWLQSMGFFVHVASDGTTGKELFDLHMDEIDIIVQDYILPGIRGEVLLEHFTSTRPDIPVIICSGYPDGRNHGWIIDKGAKAFLAKPFRIEKLVECLRTNLPA